MAVVDHEATLGFHLVNLRGIERQETREGWPPEGEPAT